MQAHLPLHTDYFSSSLQHSYLPPPSDAENYTTGFSSGSSQTYPHPDYRYSLDRGELVASRLCSPSLVGPTTLDATGLGFAGNSLLSHTGFAAPEDIIYSHQHQETWDWDAATATMTTGVGADTEARTGDHVGLNASGPLYPPETEENYFGMARHPDDMPSAVCSPAPQLPTPAAMAVLLNPASRLDSTHSGTQTHQQQPEETVYDAPPFVALLRNRPSATSSTRNNNRLQLERVVSAQEGGIPMVPETIAREKKHACTMCHKRFDRPSTLRKHLLVHTGEKAFVCETCGRRFGVASNLNRHVKRCILKPVNTPSPPSKSSPSSPATTMDTPASSSVGSPISTSVTRRDRGASSSQNSTPSSGYSTTPSARGNTRPPGQKRRRRAPSPSKWIPATLRNFTFDSVDNYRVTSVPLPPVRPNYPLEERDSWDENVGQSPYHPCSWKGVLPGPGLGHAIGLGGKDVRNLDLGGRGGTVLGRLLVF